MKPVIIIGAGRSGTNILRDLLCTLPKFGTWPCDEINYIWRHGNRSEITDELSEDMAHPVVRDYIRNRFEFIAKKLSVDNVVEKTCANSLRVEFVNKVLPEARYLFIFRDGRDVVASALKRWKASLDPVYLMKKACYVPLCDLPYYAIHYAMNRLIKVFSSNKQLAFWGPRFKGFENALKSQSLEQVAALQWQRCIENSERGLQRISEDRICRLKYEKFVRDPAKEFKRILNFLEISSTSIDLERITASVSDKSVGNWRKRFTYGEIQKDLLPLIGDTLDRYGYI